MAEPSYGYLTGSQLLNVSLLNTKQRHHRFFLSHSHLGLFLDWQMCPAFINYFTVSSRNHRLILEINLRLHISCLFRVCLPLSGLTLDNDKRADESYALR